MLKRIATLALMALITAAVSMPVEAGVGGCNPRSGVGGCGGWLLTSPTTQVAVDNPGTFQSFEDALPVQLRVLYHMLFSRPGTTQTPVPADDDTTTQGVGGCLPRAGVGGCKL